MTKQERADYILKKLNKLYPDPPIPLSHHSPYSLLIAVLLSAQCTDERVNKITPLLFSRADSAENMLKLSIEEIQSIIRPCGLSPKKAKAIYELSKILVDRYQGQVPADAEFLESLPGVGHKTASVVMSQAFGRPAFAVDTHIHRLAQRWKLSDGSNVKKTELDLKSVFPEASWSKLHLQFIYYGREFCQARKCFGLSCPICKHLFPKRKTPIDTKKA